MSHHLDSPLARRDPRLNITDQYVCDELVRHGGDANILCFAAKATNTFAGAAVHSLVLRVSNDNHALLSDRETPVRARALLATDSAGWHQVGRAGPGCR
ncbi:hypothetical protein [Paractinoplanes hotanensis]|uniref:Uncharacterized protein n=1 Tax=Paractinoplanes hotanensis TaxID=2906497 RepID=A0ABT0Y8B5_9ACTN|nr:hypothetical protein [Actinoplanes hotanensis]MCM4082285.1 hypothetical protein [Actinoplanes hotanensis]